MESQLPGDRTVEELSSLCMNCHEEGTTRLLLTQIPFFREIVLMSFSCPHCHLKNSEIQSAGQIQQRGVKYTFKANCIADLLRQIVKSDTCIVRIEDIDLEIPAGRGQLTNVEGLLSAVKSDLEEQQPERKNAAPEVYEKIQRIIEKLGGMLDSSIATFTLTISDPAGNSSIEPSPEDRSGKYVRTDYDRTEEQNAALGLERNDSSYEAPSSSSRPEYRAADNLYPQMPTTNGVSIDGTNDPDDIVENEVYSFPASCPGCTHPATTHMKMVRIPHFREVVIMSTACDSCGYRSNEVKTGGEVPEKGRRITVRVEKKEDLSRDILKGENAVLDCSELNLHVEPGTLGGRFTTIEGLLVQVRNDLKASVFETSDESAILGDSMPSSERSKWQFFFDTLDKAITGNKAFTMVLEDPLAASYVQSFAAPNPDAQIKVEDYERTKQEEEDLGLADMQTEGYETIQDTNEQLHAGMDQTNGTHSSNIDSIQRQVEARMRELEADEKAAHDT